MPASDDLHGYEWLDTTSERPGAWVQVASCFYFFEGLRPEDVAEHAPLRNVRASGPIVDHELPQDVDTAVFDGGNGWTVAYQYNGYPDQYANDLVGHPETGRAVLVYWNVNARTEFSYWEDGERIVSFDLPSERDGSDPDCLLADMNDTVMRPADGTRTVGAYYAGMLALAERITGIHLGPDFLGRPSMLIGFFDDLADNHHADVAPSLDDNSGPTWASLPAGWEPRERRSNQAAIDDIPMGRSVDVPARIARHACDSVRIADRYPIDEILDDLEHGRPPDHALMGAPWNLYTRIESAAYGGRPSHQQVWAAIQALFAAADPSGPPDPLDVLLWARIAAGDHATRVIDEVKAYLGLTT